MELGVAEKSSTVGSQINRKSRPPQCLHIRPAPSGDDRDHDGHDHDGHDHDDHGGGGVPRRAWR